VRPVISSKMSSKFLYRRSGSAVIVILAILGLSGLTVLRGEAQDRPELKRPHDVPEEKPAEPKKTKPVKGPRAVGILQLSGNGKATLIPIAILIDGKFHDASVYKADPVPMALDGGTVYEVEKTGQSEGLFTIKGALHSKNPGSPSPWIGSGSYVLNGAEVAKTSHKAEDRPVGMDNSTDAPPRLTRGKDTKAGTASDASPGNSSGTGAGKGSSEKPGTATPSGSSQQPATGSGAGGSSGQDGQKSGAPASGEGGKDQAATGQASTNQGSQDSKSQGSTSSSQASPSQGQGGNYYRPTLRRGKPTETAPEEDESAPKTDASKMDKTASPATAATANPIPVQLLPAISDAGGPDPQSYEFFWKEGEEDERRAQMLALAAAEVRSYVQALERNAIPAKPPVAKAGGAKAGGSAHKPPAKPAQPTFENVQFRAFDLWKNSQPVMILSAEAHLAPAAGSVATLPGVYNVAIAAKTDIYGNLRKLYTGVTDKFHLDVTSRLELIDAVDADGDGRGELLFHETTDVGNGYVIYRATADKLWKMFDSLAEQ
jgi:hypothetical protein